MAMYGTYKNGVIETEFHFEENERIKLVPERDKKKLSHDEMISLIDNLRGSVPDIGLSLDQTKTERIMRHEVAH